MDRWVTFYGEEGQENIVVDRATDRRFHFSTREEADGFVREQKFQQSTQTAWEVFDVFLIFAVFFGVPFIIFTYW